MFQGALGNIFQVAGYVLAALSFIDVLRRSRAPFDVVGRGSRNVWIITCLGCAYAAYMKGPAGFIAVLACILYLLDLRPKLDEVS
jgi:4-amino-4-deoxy-L-arabinose transferase-like glycosyltransferase